MIFQGEISCEQLKVIYLHNNSIRQIKNLESCTKLTHLYLQWNRITQIDNLHCLTNLKKLYLSYNEISHVGGIERLVHLEELHLEYQKLCGNQLVSIDVNSFCGVSVGKTISNLFFKNNFIELFGIFNFKDSLRVLNISGLKLSNLSFLVPLRNLEEIIATDNRFTDANHISKSISHLNRLCSAQFMRCPAHLKDFYYRDTIIMKSNSLGNDIFAFN